MTFNVKALHAHDVAQLSPAPGDLLTPEAHEAVQEPGQRGPTGHH